MKRKRFKKKEPSDDRQKMPDCLGELFGYAPTLQTESHELYWDFLEEVAQCIKPKDIIEWLWLKDVVDLSWEILRLRKLKISLIEIDRADRNATIEWEREHADEPRFTLSGRVARGAEEIE